jgi:RimJ/RimL family protein N-acetyltransferase
MNAIRTPRLMLIAATAESLSAELASPQALGEFLGCDVPASWPPELYDADAVRWTLNWLAEHPEQAGWCLYYIVESPLAPSDRPQLVGVCGYKGGPDAAGEVEIGYGIVPEQRRRGFASEAVRGMLARAFADPRVTKVIAHTLSELAASIGVLQATGFLFDGPGSDPQEPAAIRFVLSREIYEQGMAAHETAGALRSPSRSARSTAT